MAEDSGSFLVRTGLIGDDEVGRLRRAAGERGVTLFEELVLSGRVEDEALTEALRRGLELPRVAANDLAKIPAALIESVPGELCIEHRLVPVAREGDHLELAMSDPCDQGALDEVAFFTEMQVAPVIATQRQIAWCLAHYHGVITPLGETLLERAKASPTPPGGGARRRRRRSRRPATERDDEVELQPRAGEVRVRSEADATPASSQQDLPAVVLDDSLELRAALRREGTGVPESRDDQDDEVVVLTSDRKRRRSDTRLGIPPPGGRATRLADARAEEEDEIATEPGRYPPRGSDPGAGDDAPPDADGSLDDDPAADDPEEPTAPGAPFPEPAAEPATPATVAEADDATIPAERPEHAVEGDEQGTALGRESDLPPAPDSEPALADEEDDFGPPGTTIPPPYLGAVPQSYEDLDSGAIPIQAADADADESRPHEPAPAAPDPYLELEAASTDLVRTLRALDANAHRDAVIETLVAHAARRFSRSAFFVIKGGALVLWASRGSAASAAPDARVSAVPAFDAVVRSGRPFRGAVTDAASREFLEAWLGAVPDDMFAVPVSVRERVVGVLYGDTPSRRVFDEHVAVLSRAAGDAFERVLRARKQSWPAR